MQAERAIPSDEVALLSVGGAATSGYPSPGVATNRTGTPMKTSHSLGTAHRRRDAAAASIAQGRARLDDARVKTALGRWGGIVAAIKASVAAYNDGLGRERLVVRETDGPQPSVTIEAPADSIPVLVLTLDEAEIRVDCRAPGPDHGPITRWVAMTRSDDNTAAYVLQEWMERL